MEGSPDGWCKGPSQIHKNEHVQLSVNLVHVSIEYIANENRFEKSFLGTF